METSRLWVLGANDPEMETIRRVLHTYSEQYVFAISNGVRVHPGSAYACDPVPDATHWVECACAEQPRSKVIDHHRPGDPGYGVLPKGFLRASSIGQVLAELARLKVGIGDSPSYTPEIVMVAAADHCLAAAYRGLCPGVDPDALMKWRAASRAAHQGRPVDEILNAIECARILLEDAPKVVIWYSAVADMRGRNVPELPEAACREGFAYLAETIDPDGRHKLVLGGSTTPEVVRGFIDHWAPMQGLTCIYGDPNRGFAGGYL